jgi:transcriptional regulator with XRE-family HTH domain
MSPGRGGHVVQPAELVGIQLDRIGRDILFEPCDALRSRDRRDMASLREHPRERHLRRRHTDLGCNGPNLVHRAEVLLEVLALEAWVGATRVVGGEVIHRSNRSGQKPTPKRRVWNKSDPELRQYRKHFVARVACPERVLGLQRGDRVHGVGSTDVVDPRLRQADVTNLALGDELRYRTHGVFDRSPWVDPVLVIQIDVVGIETPQRSFEGGANVVRAAVDVPRSAAGVRDQPKLCGQHDLVTPSLECAADQLFVGKRAVDLGRVDERDAQVDRPVDGADGFGLVGIRRQHSHTAKANATDVEGAKRYVLHNLPSLLNEFNSIAYAATAGVPVLTGNAGTSRRERRSRTVVGMSNQQDVREFLSTRRAKITPDRAGLSAYGGNRRVPGVRREEVAVLAGMSVDYYNRVERGNLQGVSDTVLSSIARALQLDEAETAHLFDLARAANMSPTKRRRSSSQGVRPSIQRLLDAMTEAPAWIRNDRHDFLAANRLGYALYSELFTDPVRPANTARFVFLNERSKRFYQDWEKAADDIVAILRSEAGSNPYDRDLTDLIGELSTRSETFRTRWAAHNVRFHRTGIKYLHHPEVGDLELSYEALELTSEPGLTLIAYTAESGSASADGLRLLASWAATLDELDPAARDSVR